MIEIIYWGHNHWTTYIIHSSNQFEIIFIVFLLDKQKPLLLIKMRGSRQNILDIKYDFVCDPGGMIRGLCDKVWISSEVKIYWSKD